MIFNNTNKESKFSCYYQHYQINVKNIYIRLQLPTMIYAIKYFFNCQKGKGFCSIFIQLENTKKYDK